MTYHNYHELVEDLQYYEELREESLHRRGRFMREDLLNRAPQKLVEIWHDRMREKYDQTVHSNSAFSRFLKKYPIPLKEMRVLLNLLEDVGTPEWIRDCKSENRDAFQLFHVRYESSALRRHKLVFRVINPRAPLSQYYEVSYRAQLALQGKRYTDEYEQLDQVFEEDEKRNSIDALESLFYTSTPKVTFKNLILDDETKDHLRMAVERERQKEKIFKQWGLGKTIEYGRGTTLNFRGPPGTGKTMAAMVVAKELNKKIMVVRYDQLQNMYIGETEKNIQRAFKLAKQRNAVLFFDEADAIANSRQMATKGWELSQSNTLLKELERFDGICIFATNFAEKYDSAFQRRLTMHIDFKLPEQEHARQILDNMLPDRARDDGLSLDELDIENLSGGDLKNVVLNAAGNAVKDKSGRIQKKHLEQAVRQMRGTKNNKTPWYIN